MDVTHIPCGQAGWGHLTAVIDWHDREIIGYEFALRGRAQEADRALEAACLARFGTLRPSGATPSPSPCQWGNLSEPSFSTSLSRLSLASGVYSAVHTATEWAHRTVFAESQRGGRLATAIWQLQGGPPTEQWLDALGHRRTTTSIVAVSASSPISAETRLAGGLISGEHYRLSATAGANRPDITMRAS